MSEAVDNSIEYNPKSVQLYNNIREYAAAGYSKREIAKILHCGRNTVTKYLNGDYESLCKRDYRSGMDQFYDDIIKELNVYYSENVPLFRRNGYRKSGTMILRVRSRDTALN